MDSTEPNGYELPEQSRSYWIATAGLPPFEPLTTNLSADIVIVGAGIAGLTAAYLLAKEGADVVVLEAGSVLQGTTGHTTAKITAQHHLIYDELIHHFGLEHAKQYYESNRHAMAFIRRIVRELDIDCGLEDQDAYVYATAGKTVRTLELELEAYGKLGIEGELIGGADMPVDAKAVSALVMRHQAQFHPLLYMRRLLTEAVKLGVRVYEQTAAVDIDTSDKTRPVVRTSNGRSLTCSTIIAASHYPFCDKLGTMFARLYTVRSYAVAIHPERPYAGGMYISADQPKRSLRSAGTPEEPLVIIVGENHRTGTKEDTTKRYDALAKYGQEMFGVKRIPYRWSAQDVITLDKVPYIGPPDKDYPNILIATGFHKWGMTCGTAAAALLADLASGRPNPYAELYTPARFHPDPDLKKFVQHNAKVAGALIGGKLERAGRTIESLAAGEGAVVRFDGKRAGAYRDRDGELFVVDTTCTHMGCELEWNGGDKTWDCPCHGSRFDYEGGVVEGPAVKPLTRLEAPAGE